MHIIFGEIEPLQYIDGPITSAANITNGPLNIYGVTDGDRNVGGNDSCSGLATLDATTAYRDGDYVTQHQHCFSAKGSPKEKNRKLISAAERRCLFFRT